MIGRTISHHKTLEIQVPPEQLTRDPHRLDRFEREAKLHASLNRAASKIDWTEVKRRVL